MKQCGLVEEGEVLESYVTKTRDKAAALTFMNKALKRHGSPEKITMDGLRSYRAAMNELGNAEKQEEIQLQFAIAVRK
jgi:putative transposase